MPLRISLRSFSFLSKGMALKKPSLQDRFRGAMVGAVIGDCLGAPIEFVSEHSLSRTFIQKQFQKYEKAKEKEKKRAFPYTDDTAMALTLSRSILEMKGIDSKHLAQAFTEEYFAEPHRGYGAGVVDVFKALKRTDYQDPLQPAKDQFDGSGSYGNGGAMRVHPVALFGYHQEKQAVERLAVKSAEITHANEEGQRGAVLQAIMVWMALKDYSTEEMIAQLDDTVEKFDSDSSYHQSFKLLKKCLTQADDTSAMALGNSVSAMKSVPSAIYSFLRVSEGDVETLTSLDDPFTKTLQLAYSFGGDTDTIGSMAGAIAGAKFGLESIPRILLEQCESVDEATDLADELFAWIGTEVEAGREPDNKKAKVTE